MKKVILLIIAVVLLVGCGSGEDKKEDVLVIGIVQLAEHPSLDATVEGMKESLDELIKNTDKKIEYKFQNAQGDLTKVDAIIQSYVNDKVDLIYAVATNAAQSATNLTKDIKIPVVFNAVTDPVQAEIVESWDKSGNNVTGVSDLSPMETQLTVIKEFLPNATKVGVLYNVGEVNSKIQVEMIEEIGSNIGLEVISKGVANEQDLSLMAEELATQVDAFYNLTDNMVVAATPMIVNAATKNNIPVFATEDGQLDQGILAARSLSYHDLGKEAGEIIYQILIDGKDPKDIPIVVMKETKLYINEEKAEELGIEIKDEMKE